MVVFWLLVIIALVFAWFFLAPTFKFIGTYFWNLYENAEKQMTDEKEKDKNE